MTRAEENRLHLHARIAGFLFLFYIVAIALGAVLASRYGAGADWQGAAARTASSGLGHRSGLLLQLLGGMSAIPLGFSLYLLLRPIDRAWALAAFMWRVAEGVLNGVFSAFRFAGADLIAGQPPPAEWSLDIGTQLLRSVAAATFPIAVIFFSIGSLIFFWLLVKSRFIPAWLAWIGVAGSPLAMLLGLLSLLLVDTPPWLPLLWAPLAIAEIAGGFFLLVRGADLRHWRRVEPALASQSL